MTASAKGLARTAVDRLMAPGKRLLLLLLACVLLLVSLAAPSLNLPRNSYEYLFTLDITGSMNVADAGPPEARQRRIDFARQLVHRALKELPCGSRAGLSIFTEHRTFLLFSPVEICDNHQVLSTMIDAVDGGMAWAELSEVAKGLYSGIDSVIALDDLRGAPPSPEGASAGEADGGLRVGSGDEPDDGSDDGSKAESSAAKTRLVFMTDGHEAPPVHPDLRPRFRGRPGEATGLIAGVGGAELVPIPYLDENGEVAGYWGQDEVMQVDRHSAGRPSTQGMESMAGVDSGDVQARIASGTEHLSSLREGYLQQLAAETGLDYLRVTTPAAFARALLDSRYAQRKSVMTNVAWIPAALSLLCVTYVFGAQLWRSRIVSRERARRRPHRAAVPSDSSPEDSSSGDAVPQYSARHR